MQGLAGLLNKALDPQMKFKLLDMIDERPHETIDELDPEKHRYDETALNNLLREDNFEEGDDFLLWDDFTFFDAPQNALACRSEAM